MPRKKKKSRFLRIFRIIGLFLGVMVVALSVALSQVNLETLRGNILNIMRDATGLNVEIDGTISWVFSLRPKIELNNVRIKNADWAKSEYGFDADRIDVTLNLVSLLRNRPTIQNISISDAKISLEKNDMGELSIQSFDVENNISDTVTPEKTKSQPKFPFKKPGFASVDIRNLKANIDGDKYVVPNFQVRYMLRHGKREYTGWIKDGMKIFPFIVSFSEYNSERKVYPVSVAFTSGGTPLIANVALEGTSLAPIDFVVRGDIPDIAAFGRAIGQDWVELPPMMVNIAGGMGTKKITLRKSSVSIRGVNMDVSGEYDWSKEVPNVVFNLTGGDVVLYKMFPTMYSGNWVHPKRDLNAFKDIPLFGKELSHINLKANAKIKHFVVYRELALDNMDINLKSELGHGRLDIDMIFADGDFKVASDFDADAEGRIYMHAAIKAENMYIGKLLEDVRNPDVISELPMNINAYGVANGHDLSEIMQTMTGSFVMKSAGKGYMRSELVSYIYGKDTLTSLGEGVQDLFTSDDKKNEKIKISCAAVNVKLRNGLAETHNGVAVETAAINARLAGSVDLGKEKMKLALTTVPVRGLKLSVSGNLVNSIEITGNLSEPDVKVSGLSVAGKVASATGIGLLLAPLTGGLSVVAGAGIGLVAGDLLENWLADDEPCKTALKSGAPARRDDPEWLDKPVAELMDTVFNNAATVEE